jgi:DNA polymerase III delta subunit
VPSKFFPWDFRVHRPQILKNDDRGIISFMSLDPMLEGFFLNRLKAEFKLSGVHAHFMIGTDLSRDWIRENLQGSSLFFAHEPVVILCGETMSVDSKDALAQASQALSDRVVLLCSSKKNMALDERLKPHIAQELVLNLPPPWEMPKLLDYLADEFGYALAPKVKAYLLEAIEPTIALYCEAINRLKLDSPDPRALTIERAKDLIALKRVDSFEWAARFARKDVSFFHELLDRDPDYVELQLFFRFMQNYFLKMLDPSYLNKKKAPSKFDREIMAFKNQWKEPEIKRALHFFAELEILAKQKHPRLEARLRVEQLQRYL